jgi:hypothetical protein
VYRLKYTQKKIAKLGFSRFQILYNRSGEQILCSQFTIANMLKQTNKRRLKNTCILY